MNTACCREPHEYLRSTGIGILECYIADSDPELVRVWQEPVFKDTWWLVVHKDLRHAARVRAVLDFLVDQATTRHDQLLGISGDE
jgi:DNA-binding transcriptional LysR family regulator